MRGSSKGAVSSNISELIHSGKDQKQSIAIALRKAGKSKRKPSAHPMSEVKMARMMTK